MPRRCLLCLCLFFVACDENKRPPPPERPSGLALDAAPSGSAPPAGSGAEAFVQALRSQKLDVAARRAPTQRISFGKGSLAQLTDDALVIRDTEGFREVQRVPVSGPRRLATLGDGSLMVAGEASVVRLPRDPKKLQTFSRIPLFVESVLFPDRRLERRVWIAHGIDATLYPYELAEDGHLETLDFVDLADFDQRGIALLKDGSFVYTAKDKLKRFYPGGKSWTLTLPPGAEVWRILTTRRLDEVWIAKSDGGLDLARIAESSLSVVRSLDAKGAFDIASNDSELAILKLEAATTGDGGAGRVWRLTVFDGTGKEKLSQTLPFSLAPGAGESWVREVTKNRAVVLSSYGPYVAVGGAGEVTVFDYKTGERLLSP